MPKYAYVTVLYGNNIYITGAMVLGYSLMKTNTILDRIILVTQDISSQYKYYLKTLYTHVIEIDYIQVNPQIFLEETTRFRDVFTKLECLSLVQYDKIILLDLDMIVAKNIDHLFQLQPPAACVKKYYVPYGEKIPSNMICRGDQLVGGINAGLMLLKPDIDELNDIKSDINQDAQIRKYRYPEQDYLSMRYCNQWTSITFNYNFQFGLTKRVKKYRYRIDDIYVIHYSSSYKPWNELLPNYVPSPDEIEFKNRHKKYYTLWINAYQIIKEKYDKEGIVLP